MSVGESAQAEYSQHTLGTLANGRGATLQSIGIAIPASNHERTIAACITGLFAAQHHIGWRNSLWIVVVVDSSTDHTSRRARDALGAFGEVLDVRPHSPAACHRIGEVALRHHFERTPRHALLLTSVSASCVVPAHWLAARMRSAALVSSPPRSIRLPGLADAVGRIEAA